MLIRIGDEKRELIDAHLTVLKTKFLELMGLDDPVSQQQTINIFKEVIENMPHKTLIYSGLLALMAAENPAKTQVLLKQVVQQSLNTSFFNQ